MAGTVPAVSTGVFDVGGSSTMWSGGSLLSHGSQTRELAHAHRRHGGRTPCSRAASAPAFYDNEAQYAGDRRPGVRRLAENQTGPACW
jgi:hypothetical protein